MGYLDIALLSAAAFFMSAISGIVGAGGGTALLALMLQFLVPASALPAHGVVQLASNTTRTLLFWRHMSWPVIIRFSLLLPLGVWLGLTLFQGLPSGAVQILIGCFVIGSLIFERSYSEGPNAVPLWVFVPVGFVAGALNVVVGSISTILGILVVRKDLSKEGIVGTLGFFAFVSNLFKVAGFSLIGFSFVEFGPLLLCMVPCAILGMAFGKRVLVGMEPKLFVIGFRAVLIALALKLILIDGLGALLG